MPSSGSRREAGDHARGRRRSSAARGRRTNATSAPGVARRQRPQQRGLAAARALRREKSSRLSAGRERQRDQHGRRHRQRIGERERLEERAGPALHDRDGHDRQQRDQRRVGQAGCASRARPASTTSAVDPSRPSARCARRRRATFSAPTTASSITTAIATASPANEIALKRLAEQVEHERRGDQRQPGSSRARSAPRATGRGSAASTSASSRPAMISVSVRLSIASSIKVAGRNTEVSVRRPASPGSQLVERLLDALGDLERAGAGELLDDEQQAVAVVDDRVADQRLVADLDVGDVGQAQPAARLLDGHLAELPRGSRSGRARCGPAAAAAASR